MVRQEEEKRSPATKMDSGRQRSIRVAAFLIAACALATPLDPTGAVPSGYHVIRLGENAMRNLMLLYDGVIQALASIEIQPWIEACTCAVIHGDLSILLHLPAVFVVLCVVLKILSEIVTGAPPSGQQEEVEPYRRYLTAFTDTEEDARLMLHPHSGYSPGRKQRDAELYDRKRKGHFTTLRRESQSLPGHKTLNEEVVAARVIQRWVRTKFQPWMAVRRILRSPDLATNCTDRDAGAVEVTLVDHDFMSAIEQLSEHPLMEVEMNGIGMAPDAPRLDLDVDGTSSHGFPRRRGAATMSSSHIFPRRSHSDGRVLEETSPVLQATPTAPPEVIRQ